MKIKKISKDHYLLFINSKYLNLVDYNSKDAIIVSVKDMLLKVQKLNYFNMNGFYKVKVYPNKKIGVFIDIEKIDDNSYGDHVDLKVIVYMKSLFYFKTDNYECLPSDIEVSFKDEYYYVNVDDITNINKVIEFGEVEYGSEVEELLIDSTKIKKH